VGFIQENICDTVILVSGDGDLAELVISIKELGRKVEVWSFRKSIAHSLIEEAGDKNVFFMDDILDHIIKLDKNKNEKQKNNPKKGFCG